MKFSKKISFFVAKKCGHFLKKRKSKIFGGVLAKKYFCEAKIFLAKKDERNSLRFENNFAKRNFFQNVAKGNKNPKNLKGGGRQGKKYFGRATPKIKNFTKSIAENCEKNLANGKILARDSPKLIRWPNFFPISRNGFWKI